MIIEVQKLTKKFKHQTVLHDIEFNVEEGDVFGYLGPNGAGKTTTMRLLLGLLKPTSGKALVFGDYLGANHSLRRRVGVLLENNGLYERLSARENLEYYARIYSIDNQKSKIDELIQMAGLSGRENDKAGDYSKGMKRKLALVRALLHNPDLLFMDEPTSGLDPEAQIMVRDLIVELSRHKGITVFLNSHNLDEVQRICKKVAILQKGRIKAFDSVSVLRDKLSSPAVQMTFPDYENMQKAIEVLEALDGVQSCEKDGLTAILSVKDLQPSVILNKLVGQGISVDEITKLKKSLEDVYLNISQNAGEAEEREE